MSNELQLAGNNFADMAKAMGIATEVAGAKKQSNLPRFRIWHNPVMGEVEVKGKKKKMEVVEAGSFRLEIEDGKFVYATGATFRVFMQRFMYKRYHSDTKTFTKTIMGDTLNIDLKDNAGGFNCGKPSGYVEDFQALPEPTKQLIRSIKRVRVLLGEVTLENPVDENGEAVDVPTSACIWEIDNKDAFKTLGGALSQITKQRVLPIQRGIDMTTENHDLPNGGSFATPVATVSKQAIDIAEEDQQKFEDFMEWVNSYNDYIINAWNENSKDTIDASDASLVEEFIDME
jgi:hypothetical protein